MNVNRQWALSCMTTEMRLILSCLRNFEGQDETHEIHALMRKGIDWDLLMGLVERHRVPASVYQTLDALQGKALPATIRNRLKRRFQINGAQALIKTGELVRIFNWFAQEGIPMLALKGPALAVLLYGHLGLRHVGDLDIMVHPDHVKGAENVLQQNGYERILPGFELTAKQLSIYVRNSHHFTYFCPQKGVQVELHWRYGSNRYLFPLGFHSLWRDRQSVRIGGAQVPTLSVEHTFLFLCTHGAVHAWSRLFWLQDIARFLKGSPGIGWNMLLQHAIRLGICRPVSEAIILSDLLLTTPFPGTAGEYLETGKGMDRLLKMALYLISCGKDRLPHPLKPAYSYTKIHSCMLRKDIRYRLTFFLNLLGPVAYDEWQKFPLPDSLFFLHSVIRRFTWFFRYFMPGTKIYGEGPMGRGKNGGP